VALEWWQLEAFLYRSFMGSGQLKGAALTGLKHHRSANQPSMGWNGAKYMIFRH
jgi:hypothetical protein